MRDDVQAARPLRVGMVTATLPPPGANMTGTPAHVLKTVRAVRRAGAEVEVVEVDLAAAGRPLGLARALARAARDLARARADVLHVHGWLPFALVLPAARVLHRPVLVEVHGLYVASRRGDPAARPLRSRLAKALEGPLLARADHVLAQALAMRNLLVTGGLGANRVSVLYPGLDTAEFSGFAGPPRRVPGATPGERVALYVGSTHAYQGLDLLAAAQRRLPPGFRVGLAISRDAGTAEDVLRRFGFDPARTTALHPESATDLPALLAGADALVHARPDLPDNVNVQSKLGLYLASGKPIAATDVGDYRALLGGAPGCVLAPPEPGALAAAIARAASDEDVARAARW
ncbi:MAG TPA: glycosyltransferase, partial [Anaeromyxobacteraceae bacterium]|nr:glycosyltransferase [Anaeromyxobacteraceae bacterium]